MEKLSTTVSFARVVRECDCSVFEVLGASVEFLVGPQQGDEARPILKGTIPSGVWIPMHSHDVVEIFFVLSGNIEVLVEVGGKMQSFRRAESVCAYSICRCSAPPSSQ